MTDGNNSGSTCSPDPSRLRSYSYPKARVGLLCMNKPPSRKKYSFVVKHLNKRYSVSCTTHRQAYTPQENARSQQKQHATEFPAQRRPKHENTNEKTTHAQTQNTKKNAKKRELQKNSTSVTTAVHKRTNADTQSTQPNSHFKALVSKNKTAFHKHPFGAQTSSAPLLAHILYY